MESIEISQVRSKPLATLATLPNGPDVQFLGWRGVAAPHKPSENGADGPFRNVAHM